MKVIVDTNVLVSAAIADGKPENAIYAIVTRLEWEWVISAEVLAEYREVLNRPKLRLSNKKKQRWFNLIETATVNFEVAVEVPCSPL